MSKIIIFGTGGHSKVVSEIVEAQGQFEIAAYVSTTKDLKTFRNKPHFHQDNLSALEFNLGLVAIGDNAIRQKVVGYILSIKSNFKFVTAIHPKAYVSPTVKIGSGSVVMANVSINADTKIGDHCIINTSCSIDHDNQIGSFSSVAPGAILGGNCSVGDGAAVSIGAKMLHGTKVGAHSVLGAGSVLVKEMPDEVVFYGVPAKFVRVRKSGDKYL